MSAALEKGGEALDAGLWTLTEMTPPTACDSEKADGALAGAYRFDRQWMMRNFGLSVTGDPIVHGS